MKFSTSDRAYLEKRKQFAEKSSHRELWSIVDHWPLYVGVANLSRWVAIQDLVRESLDVPGDIAEFGSWRGANLLYMAKLLQILDPLSQKRIHCFDSFQGLTAFSPHDGAEMTESRGDYRGSFEELLGVIDLYELNDTICIHKGLIEDTLEKSLTAAPARTFSLVYCDTDLYESTKVILEQMHPRMAKGGLFVFDEWNHDKYPGEGVAANEFLKKHSTDYEVRSVRGARQPSLVIKKLR